MLNSRSLAPTFISDDLNHSRNFRSQNICGVVLHHKFKVVDKSYFNLRHLWRSGSVLKAGRREVPSSISGRACRPNRSEFSVVFSETGQDLLKRPPTEGSLPVGPGPTSGQLALNLQHNTTYFNLEFLNRATSFYTHSGVFDFYFLENSELYF